MSVTRDALQWQGRKMVDPEGESIGRIEAIYLDYETDTPEWALVTQGRFGARSIFVPLAGAVPDAGSVRAPFNRKAVKEAPAVEPEEQLSQEAESALYRHYGMAHPAPSTEGAGSAPSDAAPRAGEPGSAAPVRLRRFDPAQAPPVKPAAQPPVEASAPVAEPAEAAAPMQAPTPVAEPVEAAAPAEAAEPVETAAAESSLVEPESELELESEPVQEASSADEGVWFEDDDSLDEEHHEQLALTRSRYRLHAPSYDYQTASNQPVRERAVEALALSPGDVVIDVGCGTGVTFELIEELIGPEGRIFGIDLSPEMLALARERTERHGWQNVELLESSAEEARLDVRADALLISFSHDVLRSPLAVDRVMSHARPGARLAVAGAKWAPWWAPAVNSYVAASAAPFVTSLEGFDRPWTQLERHVPDLRIDELSFGSTFVASGVLPADDE